MANLMNLRRTIYLTIMSSLDFEDAGHKLMEIMKRVENHGEEMELCTMLLECCSSERIYRRYYGLLGHRLCTINKKIYQKNFERCFIQHYTTIHQFETNKIRNLASFFAHLLATDALNWHVVGYIRLTEEDTNCSSRIFIKILFQELSQQLGVRSLNERVKDCSMFPKDNPGDVRFAINFFTCIGLGGITQNLRDDLENMSRVLSESESDDDKCRKKGRTN